MGQGHDQGLADLDHSPGYQLWRANNAMQRSLKRVLVPFRLTPVQFTVLAVTDRLARQQAPATQAAVCRFATLDENMVSQVVRGLEKRGLLVREGCPGDRRAWVLKATPEGHQLLTDARTAVRAQNAQLFEAPYMAELLPLLRQLAERLEAAVGG